ncbi:MAG: hypothetical protein M3Y17_05925 [Actinomycetota bacterium]|nr:hypothetical protein [Actinomycetota bacterium]
MRQAELERDRDSGAECGDLDYRSPSPREERDHDGEQRGQDLDPPA